MTYVRGGQATRVDHVSAAGDVDKAFLTEAVSTKKVLFKKTVGDLF